ncbi:sigma-70 family RNA polymerase sigma factor [Sphingomonas sp. 2R-10]|uniref:RNA polymerase sigma factor n=1 Tax=Sphingomonas sp. 2R-10 TaxID=3045148 RepID=UPI0013DDAFC5|nr:sigma-70 family RNA polymerase sigma factor [Sphingomonas sp. 2R-10]MDJ0275271.1 sigma-70 family RNA polymerase sigma factor [Sphingomonas sp. 2R-10]
MPTNAIALSRLLLSEHSTWLRTVERVVRDRSAAEDVTQGLWFKVQTVRDDPPIDDPRAYLHRLAVNAATDELRTASRRKEEAKEEIDQLLWVEDDRPAQDRIVLGRDMVARIWAAMEALPEPTRSIFRLNRVHGTTQREIAARYDISTTIVERHIRRALRILSDVRMAE